MKQYLYILGLSIMLTGIYTSCKTDSLDTMREDEVVALDKYVKDKKLTDFKDESGIFFKDSILGTGDSIKSGYIVMIEYNITLLNGTIIPYLRTEDEYGHNYESFPFYVDANDVTTNKQYVQQIAGMHKGLKKMRIGGRAFMVIPSELAFKAVDNTGTFGIPRFSTLLATVYAKSGKSPAQQKEDQQQ